MRRVRILIYAPLAFVYGATLPLRAWWRVWRRGTPRDDLPEAIATELRARANDAYKRMPPEMRAEIDAENRVEPN